MFLAAGEGAAATSNNFSGFDIFMVLFTILIVVALVRLVSVQKKNLFAIGFAAICLLVFLFMDFWMVMNWFGKM